MPRAEGRRVEKMTEQSNEDRGFYNPFDGLKGRDGGPYLDHVNRQQAELNRALIEDREPADLNGPLPADAGTPLVVAAQVVDNFMSNPSMAGRPGYEAVFTDESFTDRRDGAPAGEADKVSIADPISTLRVDTSENAPEDPAHPNVTDVPGDNANQTVVDSTGGTSTVTSSGGSVSPASTAPLSPPPPII